MVDFFKANSEEAVDGFLPAYLKQPSPKTDASMKNEAWIMKGVKAYDPELELHFWVAGGFYYLSKKSDHISDDDKQYCNGSEGLYADAMRRGHIVVCQPIYVRLLGEYPTQTLSAIMIHLNSADIRNRGASKKQQVLMTENLEDGAKQSALANIKRSSREDIRAVAGEYYRSHIAPSIYVPKEYNDVNEVGDKSDG